MADTPLTIIQPNNPLNLTFDGRLKALIDQCLTDLGLAQTITQTDLDSAIEADNVRDDAEYSAQNIGASQPSSAGFWIDNGKLVFWDGQNNRVVDFSDGENTSLFGTPLGDI